MLLSIMVNQIGVDGGYKNKDEAKSLFTFFVFLKKSIGVNYLTSNAKKAFNLL